MQIFLSANCVALAGLIRHDLGYYIRSTKKGNFYAQRSRYNVPPDGHWRFIVLCAELAQNGLHISDIKVSRGEVKDALYEANGFVAMHQLKLDNYTARDIINLKNTFSL